MSHITSLRPTVLYKNIHTLCIYILKIVTYLFICTYHNIILNKNTVGFNLKESIYYELWLRIVTVIKHQTNLEVAILQELMATNIKVFCVIVY